jgi:hypothetical protein
VKLTYTAWDTIDVVRNRGHPGDGKATSESGICECDIGFCDPDEFGVVNGVRRDYSPDMCQAEADGISISSERGETATEVIEFS